MFAFHFSICIVSSNCYHTRSDSVSLMLNKSDRNFMGLYLTSSFTISIPTSLIIDDLMPSKGPADPHKSVTTSRKSSPVPPRHQELSSQGTSRLPLCPEALNPLIILFGMPARLTSYPETSWSLMAMRPFPSFLPMNATSAFFFKDFCCRLLVGKSHQLLPFT